MGRVRSGWGLDHSPSSKHSCPLESLPVPVWMLAVSSPGNVGVPPEGSAWEHISPGPEQSWGPRKEVR